MTIEARGRRWCLICSIFIKTVKQMGLNVQPFFSLKTLPPPVCISSEVSIQRGFRPSNHSAESQRPGSRPPLWPYGRDVPETKGEHLIWEMILIPNKLNLEVNTFKCIFRQWNLNTTAHIRPFTFWHFRRSWGSITVWEKSPWLVALHDGQFIDCSLAVLKETKSHWPRLHVHIFPPF